MKAPLNPKTYQGNQVIINSDRLVFNAKTDHVLIKIYLKDKMDITENKETKKINIFRLKNN